MNLNSYLSMVNRATTEILYNYLQDYESTDLLCRKVVENLLIESSFTKEDWEELITLIIREPYSEKRITNSIRQFSRNNRILKGEKAKIKNGIIFGRVKSFEDLAADFVYYKYYSDEDEAKEDIRSRIDKDINEIDSVWNEKKLGVHLMWATFDSDGDIPFNLPLKNKHELICSLGMNPIYDQVLLFLYRLPPDITPLVPTICDAYAGTSWLLYFTRSPEGSPFGMTLPTESCSTKVGRPEIVHEIILAENLIAPLSSL